MFLYFCVFAVLCFCIFVFCIFVGFFCVCVSEAVRVCDVSQHTNTPLLGGGGGICVVTLGPWYHRVY